MPVRNSRLASSPPGPPFVAALAGQAGFTGRSSIETWLTGILKHKIIDAISRLPVAATTPDEELDIDDFDALFRDNGTRESPPSAWERFRLRAHLAVWSCCSRFDRQMATLREAMRRYRS